MPPSQVHAQLTTSFQQELLDFGLADVHERREVIVRAPRHLHAEQLARAVVGAACPPLDPSRGHPLPDAHSCPDLERLALHADRLGALPQVARRLLQERHPHAVPSQPGGERESHRPRAHDRDLGLAGWLAIR